MALPVALQLLLLVSLSSASHFYGGLMTYSAKGRNADGSFKVDIRYKETYHTCYPQHYWYCFSGNCGNINRSQSGMIDTGPNGYYRTDWCESATVITRNIPSNRAFQLRENSCCWINDAAWLLLSEIDLGIRSDTGEPNRSPSISILPFIRNPQNCPRTYNLMAFDPDGDRVQCRYGQSYLSECTTCKQQSGFTLDQGSCTLRYDYTSSTGLYPFELQVEDFPTHHITLSYSDGFQSPRFPLHKRRRRQSNIYGTTASYPWWWYSTTTSVPTTTAAAAPWWWQTTSTPPPSPSTNSLSKLPLQFTFLVDPPAPSCYAGEYLPKFLYPTPENGKHLFAEVNKELEIRVNTEAIYSTISNIIISGPLNITKHTTTRGEFVIRWTPVLDDLGDYFPICFIAEATAASYIYQSEMRCVIVVVGRENGKFSFNMKANVICNETSMRVEVERSSVRGLDANHLRLSDPSNTACSLQGFSNSTHVIAVVPLNGCGTQIEEDDENLIFKNEITSFDNPNDIITRKHLVEVQFYCQYPKKGNVTINFAAHRRNITVMEKGFGTFTYQFEFFQSSLFQRMVDPRSYPIEIEVKEMIYMEIEATSSVNNTELFVESCRAAPYDNPNYRPTYPIIENGCVVDSTVEIYSSSHQRQFKFGMEAFKFIGLHDQVYISCSVILCEAGEPNTRCSQGCINSTSSWSDNHVHNHRKRAAIIQTAQHYISQGPLRLKKTTSGLCNFTIKLYGLKKYILL
ncbi:uncharacterized protein FYW47_000213 [Aplochiton taeniatus]